MNQQEHGACVGCTRRIFLAQGAAALAAVALAACGLSDSPTAPASITSTTLALSSYPALSSVGGVATLTVDGTPVAVVRESSTTFAAFSLICPHQGSTVGPVTNGFFCPGHGAQFDLQGQWKGGQPTGNLHSYPATFNAATASVTIG